MRKNDSFYGIYQIAPTFTVAGNYVAIKTAEISQISKMRFCLSKAPFFIAFADCLSLYTETVEVKNASKKDGTFFPAKTFV